MAHIDQHKHAFIDYDDVVVQLAAFDENAHDNHQLFEVFCQTYGYKKAICCCTHGEPYIGDKWDEKNEEWIENLDLRKPENTVIINGEVVTPQKAIEQNEPKNISNS